ncbi:MAG: DUF2283 domain-containing protein [Candidatus Nanoarchaeia archaeon]|nr:DUF2283 domain-containing protein [Candidatus Nanoarchaeia archaeon]
MKKIRFNFDYDFENDSLFLFDPKSKSKASIELDDFIIDFNSHKEVSAIELLNASSFFKGIDLQGKTIDKELLKDIQDCKIELTPKSNFTIIKFLLLFKSKKLLTTPVFIPTIKESSPAVAY